MKTTGKRFWQAAVVVTAVCVGTPRFAPAGEKQEAGGHATAGSSAATATKKPGPTVKPAEKPATETKAASAGKIAEPPRPPAPIPGGHEAPPKPEAKPAPQPTGLLPSHTEPSAAQSPGHVSPDAALAMLIDGNTRYTDSATTAPHRDQMRRCETLAAQTPIASILTCADSRVPPELIFDQGIGDLFVVRVAGNVAGADETGTLEYGVEHLGVSLIVVMGHARCGAVKAAVDGVTAEGDLGTLIDAVRPGIEEAKASAQPGVSIVTAAVRANVKYNTAKLLTRSPLLAEAVKSGKVKIVGAIYDIHSGAVQWLNPPPLAGPSDPLAPAHGEAESHAPTVVASAEVPRNEEPARELIAEPTASTGHGEKPSHAEPPSHEPRTGGHESAISHDTAPQAEAGESAHADAETHSATSKPTANGPRDNWVLLGALGFGATGMSFGVINFLGKKKKA